MYSLVKRIQKHINNSLYGNDVNLFIRLYSTVEAIRQRLGLEYQRRSEVISKVRDLRKEKKKKINEENVTIESQQCDPVIDSEMQIEVCVQSV